MKEIYVVSSCRTAVGTFGGSLKDVSAAQLGAAVMKEALQRAKVKGEWLDEVMFGNVLGAAQGQNMARQCMVGAGIPYKVPAYTTGMVCGSGLKTIIEGARSIAMGDADLVLCGGTESMSNAPYAVPSNRWGARMGNTQMIDVMVNDGLWDTFHNYHMGTTAENICDIWGLTRQELDEFALSSQEKALAAIQSGRFADEIVPISVKKKKETVTFATDEGPRSTSMESLSGLKPAFVTSADGSLDKVEMTFDAKHTKASDTPGVPRVTAGNASGINDGAAAILLASPEAVKKYGLTPLFKVLSWGHGGVDPKIMGIGPVPATQEALKKASLTISDLDLIEANEAFAAQSIAVARELDFDMAKVNVNGGAIAIGHPIGASGARITVTLLHEMAKRPDAKRGLATLCIGGGLGVAVIFEKV